MEGRQNNAFIINNNMNTQDLPPPYEFAVLPPPIITPQRPSKLICYKDF